MTALECYSEDDFARKRITTGELVQLVWAQSNLFMLFQPGQWSEQVVRCVALPVEWETGWTEQRINERLKDSLAIGTIGQDQDPVAILAKAECKMPPSFVVTLLEEGLAVGRGVQSPADSIAQANAIV